MTIKGRIAKQALDAHMNQIIFLGAENRLIFFDKAIRVLGSISGAAAVASWAYWKSENGKLWWAALTGFVAVLNAISVALNPGDMARKRREFYQSWTELRYEFDELFDSSQNNKALEKSYQKLMEKRKKLESNQPPRPMKRTIAAAQAEVRNIVRDDILMAAKALRKGNSSEALPASPPAAVKPETDSSEITPSEKPEAD